LSNGQNDSGLNTLIILGGIGCFILWLIMMIDLLITPIGNVETSDTTGGPCCFISLIIPVGMIYIGLNRQGIVSGPFSLKHQYQQYNQPRSHPPPTQYPCPRCGNRLNYVEENQSWYCYQCEDYSD